MSLCAMCAIQVSYSTQCSDLEHRVRSDVSFFFFRCAVCCCCIYHAVLQVFFPLRQAWYNIRQQFSSSRSSRCPLCDSHERWFCVLVGGCCPEYNLNDTVTTRSCSEFRNHPRSPSTSGTRAASLTAPLKHIRMIY